jgi:hypothetical protein
VIMPDTSQVKSQMGLEMKVDRAENQKEALMAMECYPR